MKQRMTLFMAILLIGIGLSNAQVSQVTGNVMSEEDGLPVVGASVLVKCIFRRIPVQHFR